MDFARVSFKVDTKDLSKAIAMLQQMGVTAKSTSTALTTAANKSSAAFASFQKNMAKMTGSLSTFSNQLNAYVVLPLVAVGAAAVKMSVDLNKGLADVGTLIPGQREQLNAYKEDIKDLSVEVGKSFTDLSRGLYEVISAFPGTMQAIEITEVAAKTARAGLSTTKQALDLLSATTKAYGDTSLEAQEKVANLAFGAVKYGQTTFLDLSQAIQVVTPYANQLNISMEEMFATFSTFTGVTGSAEMVATQLRSALVSLLNPTQEMKQVYSQLGVESGKALIQQRGLLGAVQAITGQADKMSYPIQKVIRRIEGITFVSQLGTAQLGKYKDSLKELQSGVDFMGDAFIEQTQGINEWGFVLEQSVQRIKVSLSELGDTIAPVFATLVSNITKFIDKIASADKDTIQWAVATGKVVLEFGLLLKVFSVVLTTINALIPAIQAMATGLSIAAGPLGIILGLATAGGFAIKLYLEKDRLEGQQELETLRAGNSNYGKLDTQQLDMVRKLSQGTGQIYDEVYKMYQMFDGTAEFIDLSSTGKKYDEIRDNIATIAKTFNLSFQDAIDIMKDSEGLSESFVKALENYSSTITDNRALEELQAAEQRDRSATTSAIITTPELTPLEEAIQKSILYKDTLYDLAEAGKLAGGVEEARAKTFSSFSGIYEDFIGLVEAGELEGVRDQSAWRELLKLLDEFKKKSGGVDAWTKALADFNAQMNLISERFSAGLLDEVTVIEERMSALQTLINKGYELGRPMSELQEYINTLIALEEALPSARYQRSVREFKEATADLLDFIDNSDVAISFGEKFGEAMEGFDPGNLSFASIKDFASGMKDAFTSIPDPAYTFSWDVLEYKLNKVTSAAREAFDNAMSSGKISDIAEALKLLGQAEAWDTFLRGLNQIMHVVGGQMTDVFESIGAIMYSMADATYSSADAYDKLRSSAQDMAMTLAEMIPKLMISVGLQLLPSPAGWALLGLGLAGTVVTGMAKAGIENIEAQESATAATQAYANGGVFGAFSNSVVNTPKMFAFASGTGLMGEAGAEAIMPLSRTQSGELGVKAIGGGGDVTVNVINNSNDTTVETRERQTNAGKAIDVIIKNKVVETLSNGTADGAMRSRYGLVSRGVR
jgi:TP901 family phage tail tape measure protein/lambda family phage tail tape measure protein